jgi:hypothetical protein
VLQDEQQHCHFSNNNPFLTTSKTASASLWNVKDLSCEGAFICLVFKESIMPLILAGGRSCKFVSRVNFNDVRTTQQVTVDVLMGEQALVDLTAPANAVIVPCATKMKQQQCR